LLLNRHRLLLLLLPPVLLLLLPPCPAGAAVVPAAAVGPGLAGPELLLPAACRTTGMLLETGPVQQVCVGTEATHDHVGKEEC
jgi:hypothetical protein